MYSKLTKILLLFIGRMKCRVKLVVYWDVFWKVWSMLFKIECFNGMSSYEESKARLIFYNFSFKYFRQTAHECLYM